MYSRNIHNINDVFEELITVFNTFSVIKKCNKTNVMEFHFKPPKTKGVLIIFLVILTTLTQTTLTQ
jgi:hypothetical protein